MSNTPFSQQDVEAFTTALNSWSESLPKNLRAVLEHVMFRSSESTDALSDDQLKGVVGGGNRVVYTPAQTQAIIQDSDVLLQTIKDQKPDI